MKRQLDLKRATKSRRRRKLRALSHDEAKSWLSQNPPIEGPINLRRALNSRESVPHLIEALIELANSEELKDPAKAPGHLAILIEMLVWRFQELVRSGELDAVPPRLTALPMLYSPRNGEGAGSWKMARDLFESKRVGEDAPVVHHGLEPGVARSADYGVAAAEIVRLARLAGYEFNRFDEMRQGASAMWDETIKRTDRSKPFRVSWYDCGDRALRWPSWLDLCKELPARRTDAPARYRAIAKGILAEFFAWRENQAADELLPRGVQDSERALAVAEAKRRILDAIDRL